MRYSINGPPFMNQLVRLVREGQIDRAVKLCSAAPNAALAKVLRAGLTRANRGEQEVATAMEETIMEVIPLIQKRIGALWSVANIAVLVGLLGTVTGLIRSFGALAKASPAQKGELLSRGISEAMNNTAFGLGIAVVCIIGHMMLTLKSKAMVEEIELNSLRLENLLAQRAQGETSAIEGGERS
jgi:biopolymer transport protein ExbB/TolQ